MNRREFVTGLGLLLVIPGTSSEQVRFNLDHVLEALGNGDTKPGGTVVYDCHRRDLQTFYVGDCIVLPDGRNFEIMG